MPRFAANLSLLFTELPLERRFEAAKKAGFDAVELLFPYELPAHALKSLLADQDLALVLINTPAGDWAKGERGFAALPDQIETFRTGFERALTTAQTCNATHIHVMAGLANSPAAHTVFIENLIWAAALAPDQSLTIEPINPIDMPNYFLNSFDQAATILAEVNASNLSLQFDTYHAHRITGDVPCAWKQFAPLIHHIQIAGYPGRHEPLGGEINYPAFFAQLDNDHYSGWVSGEYNPKGQTLDGLQWINN